jgi:hypothetical protein
MAANPSPIEHAGPQTLLGTPDLPELGPGPRSSVLPLAALTGKLDECLSHSGLPAGVHQPIRALVLLWHDHLDASHRIAQDLPGPDGSLLHGIMHRREPDYSNAKYWFHRVGKHPCFPRLAGKVEAFLEAKNEAALLKKLVPNGEWDPFAFVDACERAASQPGSDSKTELLRAVQGMELRLLLEWFCQSEINRPASPAA